MTRGDQLRHSCQQKHRYCSFRPVGHAHIRLLQQGPQSDQMRTEANAGPAETLKAFSRKTRGDTQDVRSTKRQTFQNGVHVSRIRAQAGKHTGATLIRPFHARVICLADQRADILRIRAYTIVVKLRECCQQTGIGLKQVAQCIEPRSAEAAYRRISVRQRGMFRFLNPVLGKSWKWRQGRRQRRQFETVADDHCRNIRDMGGQQRSRRMIEHNKIRLEHPKQVEPALYEPPHGIAVQPAFGQQDVDVGARRAGQTDSLPKARCLHERDFRRLQDDCRCLRIAHRGQYHMAPRLQTQAWRDQARQVSEVETQLPCQQDTAQKNLLPSMDSVSIPGPCRPTHCRVACATGLAGLPQPNRRNEGAIFMHA